MAVTQEVADMEAELSRVVSGENMPKAARPVLKEAMSRVEDREAQDKAREQELLEAAIRLRQSYEIFAKETKRSAFNLMLLTATQNMDPSQPPSPANYDAFLEYQEDVDTFLNRILQQK